MKQEHYVHPTGFAFGLTAGIVYSVCAFFVAVAPGMVVKFVNTWFHSIDLGPLMVAKQITFGTFFAGLVSVLVSAYVVGVLYALIYNACVDHCKRKKWIR